MSNKDRIHFQNLVTFLEKAQEYISQFGLVDGLALAKSEMSGMPFKFEKRNIQRLEKELLNEHR